MTPQQMNMFPQGEDLPLFSGTPIKVRIHTSEPREGESQARLSICPLCQDTGKVITKRKRTEPVFCTCEAGQTAKAKARLEGLPESKRVEQLREMYAEPGGPVLSVPKDDTGQVLREAMAWDNPNARLASIGPQALTLIELLSVVLGTERQPDVGARVLAECRTIAGIRSRSIAELAASTQLTFTRAKRLAAALELGRRAVQVSEERPYIKSPADAAQLLRDMGTLDQEQMRVLALDTKNRVIETVTVYQGSVHTTVIRVCELMKAAIRVNATSIIIAHSHPSGDPTPSPEDVAVTTEIVKAAKILDLDCIDHLVIGSAGKFVSLKERGLGFS
jgi:DNA repair protein RadC